MNLNAHVVRAVVFDAYGTLVQVQERRSPYKQLLRLGETQGRPVTPEDKVAIMSQPMDLVATARMLGIVLSDELRDRLADLLAQELTSIDAYAEVASVFETLRSRGYKLAVCSNLAQPYAEPVLRNLPFFPDAVAWSFDVGAVKPAPTLYHHACQYLDLPPAHVLMVGDSVNADVFGPRACGLQAIHLRRGTSFPAGAISSLADLLDLLPVRLEPS